MGKFHLKRKKGKKNKKKNFFFGNIKLNTKNSKNY